jgi:hypothetical protein
MTLYAILMTLVVGALLGSLATFKYLIYSGTKEMEENARLNSFDKAVEETLEIVHGPILT